MINFNPIRTIGALSILGLAACSTSYNASRSGQEMDNLYFMASDARIATEFAVKNNNPQNFEEIEEIRSFDGETDNFSAKNVNPEYIAKYQRSTSTAEEGTVYFDDSQSDGQLPQGQPNINAYDNFRGANGNNTGITNNFFMNPMMGMGMYPMMGMGGMYNPYWGSGFGGMGMYDPFWGSGFGFRPGFNLSLSMGMGMGWGSPFMRPGFGFYDPFWGSGFGYRPGFGGFYGGGMWGRNIYSPVIVLPGGNEGNRRQVVQGARPGRGSSLANTASRSTRSAAQPSSSRASARREAMSSSAVSRNRAAGTTNSFSRSQNDYYNAVSAAPARRNINSPAMNRAGNTSTRSSYNTPSRSNTYNRTQAPSNTNSRTYNSRSNARSTYSAPRSNSRSSSPSYNRSRTNRTTTPSYQQRSTSPSRNSYSAPSRSSSSYSAPSRSSSGGGSSRGGSVGGSRRGN